MKKAEPGVLIVSGEKKFLAELQDYLQDLPVPVATADNGLDALKIAKKKIPGLIVFDTSLPKMNGIEAGRMIRQDTEFKNTYIYFLISSGADYAAVNELKPLADDCFLKPVNFSFLARRIRERFLSHQHPGQEMKTESRPNSLVIDRETYMVYFRGDDFMLPKKEFELLHLLSSVPEKVFTRAEIFMNVWNKELSSQGARTIDVHIRKLREKLGGINIITVKGVGYKLSLKEPFMRFSPRSKNLIYG